MALSHKNKRRLVVAGQTYRYRANFGYDQLWTDGGGLLVVRDDRKVRVALSAPGAGDVSRCLARVSAPTLPWFAGRPRNVAFAVPVDVAPGWTPGVVAKVIAWCLDPAAARVVAPEPGTAPAPLPDERTAGGFVARLWRPPGRDLRRAVDVAEEVLERPLLARPLDPVARDLTRSRRLLALVWETLAARGVIPDDWAHDPARGFAATAERRLPGEDAPAVDGFGATCVALRAPPSLRCALALASDVAGVLRAEALARESVARFEAMCGGAARPGRALLWRTLDDRYALSDRACGVAPGVLADLRGLAPGAPDEAQAANAAPAERDDPRAETRFLPYALALSDRRDAASWALACGRELRLPAQEGVARRWVGRGFGDVPDPYAPLLDLWRSGYGLETWTASGVLLIAPGVPFD